MSAPAPVLHEARCVEIVFPHHCNHLGTLFGGQALAWMDKAAFLAASGFAGATAVTARSDRIDFQQPVRLGEVVDLVARVTAVGRSSMTVRVHLYAQALPGKEKRLATRGEFVMVAVDGHGKARPVSRRLADAPP